MFLLFDIGGTNTRVAVSGDLKKIEGEPKVFKTPERIEDGVEMIKNAANELLGERKLQMGCGGVAGPLNKERAELVNSPNNSEWVGKPLKKELENTLGAPVILENDAALVGLGEWKFGAGNKSEIMVYVTVSTGVGSSRIVNGAIDTSIYGFEPGHQIIDIDNTLKLHGGITPSGEKKRPDLEDTVSGSSLERRSGRRPYEIDDDQMWDKFAEVLAVGLHNTVVHWSPEVMVLGGSMILKRPGISIKAVENYLSQELYIYPTPPELRQAELEDYGGLYGAMELIRQNIF